MKTASVIPAALAPILTGAAYPLPLFKQLTQLDTWAMRQARKAGLRTRRVGRRRFVLGADWLTYLESLTDEVRE